MICVLGSSLGKRPVMADNDPKRTCWQRQRACSLVLCRTHDNLYYMADYQLIFDKTIKLWGDGTRYKIVERECAFK